MENMIQSAINNVIVQVATKYIKNMTAIARMAAIQNDTSIEPADYYNIVGVVVSSPKSISERREYNNYSQADIKEGDTVIFSNYVIGTTIQTEPDAEPIFKNLFWYKGKEYWAVNIDQIYAVIRDGKIRMQNGYVMLENLEAPLKIILQTSIKRAMGAASATVSQITPNTEVKIGDDVFFKSTQLRVHQVNEKPFGIIKMEQILGKKRK